jgi:hypothetical protein
MSGPLEFLKIRKHVGFEIFPQFTRVNLLRPRPEVTPITRLLLPESHILSFIDHEKKPCGNSDPAMEIILRFEACGKQRIGKERAGVFWRV